MDKRKNAVLTTSAYTYPLHYSIAFSIFYNAVDFIGKKFPFPLCER